MTPQVRSQDYLPEEVTPPDENEIAIPRKSSKCFPQELQILSFKNEKESGMTGSS